MGIDIYVEWQGQTAEEREALASGFVPDHLGNVRERYPGSPFATYSLVPEAFNGYQHKANIPAHLLRERLSETMECVRAYERDTGQFDQSGLAERFAAFVNFCERKEEETGEPVRICVRPVF